MDDASQLAYTATHVHETSKSAVEVLWCTVAWYKQHGIEIKRVLTDNGACFKSCKLRHACRELGIQHKRTKPYHPQTNGNAGRLIRTALKVWAYESTYTHSWKRTQDLAMWTYRYHFQRPYPVLGRKPPTSRPPGVGTTC